MLGLNSQMVAPDKPLDWVADCAHPFCGRRIYFKERCIKSGPNHYCSDRCFIDWLGGEVVKAGTEEPTF